MRFLKGTIENPKESVISYSSFERRDYHGTLALFGSTKKEHFYRLFGSRDKVDELFEQSIEIAGKNYDNPVPFVNVPVDISDTEVWPGISELEHDLLFAGHYCSEEKSFDVVNFTLSLYHNKLHQLKGNDTEAFAVEQRVRSLISEMINHSLDGEVTEAYEKRDEILSNDFRNNSREFMEGLCDYVLGITKGNKFSLDVVEKDVSLCFALYNENYEKAARIVGD